MALLIEIGAPASLPLGIVQVEQNNDLKTCLLGVTLQHPPVHLNARKRKRLSVTGARADKGYEYALHFLEYHHLQRQAEVEIELSIPAFVGLGSDAMLGLSIAQALSWVHDLPLDNSTMLAQALGLSPYQALEIWGFDQGGLLLVDTESPNDGIPAIIHRKEIQHSDKDAWAFILYFPRASENTPKSLEADNLNAWLLAAPHLNHEQSKLVLNELWSAVDTDCIDNFALALNKIQSMNQEALNSAGISVQPLTRDDEIVLDVMRENGALACGRIPTGIALFALIKGASGSVNLRHKIREKTGHFSGIAMAAITDNAGARYVIKDSKGVPKHSRK